MSQIVTCPPAGCKTILSSACVFYEGPNLLTTDVKTNDSVEVVIQKFDQFVENFNPGTSNDVSFVKNIFQIAHGFSVGDAIRNSSGKWVKAQADTFSNAGTVGVVSNVQDSNNFSYQFGAHLDNGGPWIEGQKYFLSTSVPGEIVFEESYSGDQVREYIGTGTEHGLLIEINPADLYQIGVINHNHSFVFEQNTPSSSWVIVHNLNRSPSISIVDSGNSIVGGNITYINQNEVRVDFNSSFAGKAYLN